MKENKLSYFNVIKDSLAIYLSIIKFSMSSIISALLDLVLLMIMERITSSLFISVFIARVFSATFNYIVNREYVFSKTKDSLLKGAPIKYILLVLFIMLLNYEIMKVYISLGLPLLVSKVCTESTLFFFSYWVQKKYIFRYIKK